MRPASMDVLQMSDSANAPLNSFYDKDRGGRVEMRRLEGGDIYLYVNVGEQASIHTDEESIRALRDACNEILGEGNGAANV